VPICPAAPALLVAAVETACDNEGRDVVAGPAVIEEPNSTILIHPGRVTVTPAGHLIIDLALET
jgi:N-methylhydantoinase A/oxoprolinase/acetone carboxylase beta subunit